MARTRLALLPKKVEGELDWKASKYGQEDVLERFFRCWMVGCQSVSSLSDGGRYSKAQTLPLSRMALSEARSSGSFQEMGAKGENIKERIEMANGIVEQLFCGSYWKLVEREKFQDEDVEVCKAPKLEFASRRFHGQCGR